MFGWIVLAWLVERRVRILVMVKDWEGDDVLSGGRGGVSVYKHGCDDVEAVVGMKSVETSVGTQACVVGAGW